MALADITRARLLGMIAQATAASGGDSISPPRFSLLADCRLGEEGAPYEVREGLTGTIDNSLIPRRRPGSALPLKLVGAGLDCSRVWVTVEAAQAWCDAHQTEP